MGIPDGVRRSTVDHFLQRRISRGHMITALRILPAFLIALSICVFHASRAEGADWVLVMENEEARFYGDNDSASKKSSPSSEARELSIMKNHKEISRSLEVVEYDCSGGKRRAIQTLKYYNNGSVTLDSTLNASWEPVEQTQKAKVFFNFICKKY